MSTPPKKVASGKKRVREPEPPTPPLPIDERSIGSSTVIPQYSQNIEPIPSNGFILSKIWQPKAAHKPLENLKAWDETFQDYWLTIEATENELEACVDEGMPIKIRQANVPKLAARAISEQKHHGLSEKSKAFHESRHALITEHSKKLQALIANAAQLSEFSTRRTYNQDLVRSYVTRFGSLPPVGTHSSDKLYCDDSLCETCKKRREKMNVQFQLWRIQWGDITPAERGMPVGVFREDPLGAQRPVYAHIDQYDFNFRVGSWTLQGQLFNTPAANELITREFIKSYDNFRFGLTTHTEGEQAFAWFQQKNECPRGCNSFEDMAKMMSEYGKKQMAEHRARIKSALDLLYPVIAGTTPKPSYPHLQLPSEPVTLPLGIYKRVNSAGMEYKVLEVSIGPATRRDASRDEIATYFREDIERKNLLKPLIKATPKYIDTLSSSSGLGQTQIDNFEEEDFDRNEGEGKDGEDDSETDEEGKAKEDGLVKSPAGSSAMELDRRSDQVN